MACQPVRFALLFGAITAVAVSHARAESCAPAPCAPKTRTIRVTECVPETYTTKRTTYKVECRTEQYDTTKCVCVPETRERVCNVVKRVPVTEWQTRKVCKTVTVNEERTVMKTCYKNVQETVMQKKLVSRGHWECREREALLGNLFSHRNSCDPCGNSCGNSCPRTRTHRVWVHCPKYECCPVTVCKRVKECVATKCVVPVCKQVMSEEKVQVCSFKCVEEKRVEKYTVNVMKQVTCKATRTVRVCVPHEETVTCTRMVQRTVCREVPCETSCTTDCCSSGHRLRGMLHRNNGGCCR